MHTVAASPPLPPLVTRPFVLLVIAHFLQALGYSSLLLLPLYLDHLNASRAQIGAIMATAAVSSVAVYPLVSWSLDRVGRRPTLIAGTMVLSAAMTLIFWCDRIGPLIYLTRALIGMGIGILFSSYFTAAADLVPPERRTEGLALFGLSGLLPLMINPFADRIGIAPADLRWFLPAIGGVVAMSLFALVAMPEPSPNKRIQSPDGAADHVPKRPLGWRETVGLLLAARLWPVWLATVIFGSLVALFMTFGTVTANARGIPHAPMMWLSYALGAALVRTVGRRLPDRLGPANLVAPGLAVYLLAALLMTQAASLNALLVASAFAGIGHGYLFPVLSSQLVSRVPKMMRGAAMSTFTFLWGLSELSASPAFGRLADTHGDAAMFLAAFLIGASLLIVWLWLEHRHGRQLPAQHS